MPDFYRMSLDDTFRELDSSKEGISERDAEQRLEKYGTNQIESKKKTSDLALFVSQFRSVLIIILIIAIVVSFLLGEVVDAAVILVIIIINGTAFIMLGLKKVADII